MFEFDGIIVVVTAVIILMIIANQGRRNLRRNPARVCPGCGAIHPPFAQFCRRCGHHL